MNVQLEELRPLAEQNRYDALAKELEQTDVQKHSKEQQEELDALFSTLPKEKLEASAELIFRMVLLKLQLDDLPAAQRYYGSLVNMRDTVRESSPTRPMLDNRIFLAALCLPQDAGSNLLLSLAVLANECEGLKFTPARVSATGKFPSVLRGAKDLSSLARHYRASVSIVRPLLGAFLEENGAGVCETAIAELLYERGELSEASLQAAAAINAENPEIAFAALAQLARIGAVDPTAKPPAEILAHIGAMLEKKQANWLIPNYRALCARFDILNGEIDKIREWVDNCGLNDLGGFPLRDAYGLITKAKAYIALGEHSSAATLLEGLTLAAKKQQRVLDTVECLANGAVACELMGNTERAEQKLEQALLLAQDFGYIRVFADLGKHFFHLITRCAKETPLNPRLNERYVKKITEAARIFSTLYPALYNGRNGSGQLQPEENGELTQSEVLVLQLLDEGKPNKAIAAQLHVQPSTVNFHLKNIFEKLNASNRTEAVKIAREKGLLV